MQMGEDYRSMKIILMVLLCGAISNVNALELFGIELQNASRNQLRTAVKNSGVQLISEAGEGNFFDVYDSSEVFKSSTRLYLGFVKENNKFAFAEYEFNGLQNGPVLRQLIQKYGKATKSRGLYLSDSAWNWQIDSIQISLQTDWPAYKTRLIYQDTQALQQLRQEQAGFLAEASQQVNKNPDNYF